MAALLVSFLLLMILGCPIAFCLLCSGTIYFMTNNMALIMVVQRLTEGANTFTLLAVPGFILAGNLMNSGEVTDRIFDFCGKLVGHITGGLGHANILASVVFAGMSGAAIADAGGLGAIELKAMHDAGYDDDFSLAVTGASSLVGPIIPPSVPAVVYGTVASVSIGRLFMAGAVPGAIMAIAMCVMVYIISRKRGYRKEEWCGFRALFHSFRRAFLSLLTVVVILGGILAGIFTPTEAAGVSVIYGLFVGVFIYREIHAKELVKIFVDAAVSSATIMFIIACAAVYAWIMTTSGVAADLSSAILSVSENKIIILIIINVIFLIAGCFLDANSAFYILLPIITPVLASLGVDMVHAGVFLTVNMAIGLITPPVGINLYVGCKAGEVSVAEICRKIVPFLIAGIVSLLLITYVEPISMFLPRLFGQA